MKIATQPTSSAFIIHCQRDFIGTSLSLVFEAHESLLVTGVPLPHPLGRLDPQDLDVHWVLCSVYAVDPHTVDVPAGLLSGTEAARGKPLALLAADPQILAHHAVFADAAAIEGHLGGHTAACHAFAAAFHRLGHVASFEDHNALASAGPADGIPAFRAAQTGGGRRVDQAENAPEGPVVGVYGPRGVPGVVAAPPSNERSVPVAAGAEHRRVVLAVGEPLGATGVEAQGSTDSTSAGNNTKGCTGNRAAGCNNFRSWTALGSSYTAAASHCSN